MRSLPTLSVLKKKLLSIDQAHLLQGDPSLRLQKEVASLDARLVHLQCQALETSEPQQTFEPLRAFHTSGCLANRNVGKKNVQKGQCACVILAGGTGSRLRWTGPKGCF